MSAKELIIEGARQNNLKNISISLPHNKVIAVTGVSGSGKSSLAFDTIFAEGQWRFVESLSTYARLFLEKLDRPDVDGIYNIRPAIALEQNNPVRGSRSTVGTMTEIYDLFRLLFEKVSTPCCPSCGVEIRMWDPSQVVRKLTEEHGGERAVIVFESSDSFEELQKRGFHRILHQGKAEDIDTMPPQTAGPYEVVVDRIIIKPDQRLSDSVEMAWREGKGRISIVLIRHDKMIGGRAGHDTLRFSDANACDTCGVALPLPTAILFSFNHPVGACPVCKGFGNTLRYDEDLLVPDRALSLADGAIDPWNKPAYVWWKKQLLKKGHRGGLDIYKPYRDLSAGEKDLLFKGNGDFYGIDDFFEDLEGRKYKLHVRVFLSRYRRAVECSSCAGKRLRSEALAYKVSGLDIGDLARMSIADSARFLEQLDLSPFRKKVAKEILRQISMKLGFLLRVGIGYIALDRYGRTLSGGEFQRVNLSNQLASLLTGTLYVLDEPTVGLHPRDTERIGSIMAELAGLGNTVIVVEHDRGIIAAADWIVELGPGGGHRGGEVVFSGTSLQFRKADTLTARYLKGIEKVDVSVRKERGTGGILKLTGAKGNNLKNLDLVLRLRSLTVVTGVSGSGKSSLVVETLYRALARHFRSSMEAPLPFDRLDGFEKLGGVRLLDQSPIGRSPRSNPVTYLKIFDAIRKIFADQKEAKTYGYGPGAFSFNIPGGRCEACKGEGYEKLEMFFFENLYVKCEKCDGKKYRPEILRVRFRGKNIHEVLNMTVEEALVLFIDEPSVWPKLSLLAQTGLGYIRLGQPSTTLSGGEAQRLKICAEMGSSERHGYLYILDEPTVGLHFDDVKALLAILLKLVDSGNTVVVIEHNPDVVKAADRIIDLGPEGGDGGGSIVFDGTPAGIVESEVSHTGKYLRDYMINVDKAS